MFNKNIVEKAARYWTDRISSSYTYIHSGNIKYKIERQSILNGSKVIVFNNALTNNLARTLESSNGYIQIRDNSEIVTDALKQVNIVIPNGYLKNNSIMYIEDDELFIYEDGMNRAMKI